MFAALGVATIDVFAFLGGTAMVAQKSLVRALRANFDLGQFFYAMITFGEKSLAVALATSAFAGMLMVLQAAIYVKQYNGEALVGWYVGFTTFRETGPVLVALMFSGRVGASHTSELATMKVNEQLDALKILAIDVYSYLIVPRVLAMALSLVALVAFGNVVSIVSGAFISHALMGIDYGAFVRSLMGGATLADFLWGIAKSGMFALCIALVGTYCALSANKGARGVGQAVNMQVVASAVGIFAIDYFVTLMGAGF